MALRERIQADTKEAMKAKETARLSTLRLITAAIKDREIAARTEGGDENGLTEADLTAILSRMVKQRQESAKAYEEGGRLELAEREQDEIKVIQSYLHAMLESVQALSMKYLVSGRVEGPLRRFLTIDIHESGYPVWSEIAQMAADAAQLEEGKRRR